MKHLSFLLRDNKAYNKAKIEFQKKRYKSKLIQVFCGFLDKKEIKKILNQLQKDFEGAILVGTTTAGEISHAKMYEKSVVISLSLFEKTTIKTKYVKKIDAKNGKKVAKNICEKHTKAMIVLSEGLKSTNYEKYLNGIKEVKPDVIVAGGLAGDNFKLKKTYIFLDNNIYDCGSVAISLSSKKLFASNRYNLNWIPIGKEFKITKVKNNIVLEIDNIPAVKFFEKYLGHDVLKYSSLVLPNFQLLFKEGSTMVARTPLTIDNNSLVFAGTIKKNQIVRFGFSNESAVIDGSYKLRQKISSQPSEAIYIFSCIARKTLLGKTLEKEFKFFEDVSPTAGFFTYGEFYSTDAKDVLLNCTTTVLILSESKKVKKLKKEDINKKTLDNITFNALAHFIEQTSIELKTNIKLMNQYKDVVDSSSLVSKTDKNGLITYINDNFCKVSKYTKEELLGKSHNLVRDKNVPTSIFKNMWKNISSGKIWKGIFSNRAKDGTIYYVDATIMPIFDDNGNIDEYIAIRQDITKQIQATKRMQEKEKLIRAIFDNQDSIVIYASKSDGMKSVNKKLFEYFNYEDFEDFKSKNRCICDLFLEEEGYIYTSKYPNWLEDIALNDDKDYKVKMKTKMGAIHTFNIKVKKINDEYIINLYDITNLEQALLKAYSSQRAKSMFLANMSHEIRTPLNGILGFSDLLSKKRLDKDSKRYVDIINKSGQTLLNVVNDILDFSKIESGELSLYETQTNLFEEMEATVSTFASISKSKKIDYYVYIDTNIPKSLKCDVQRLKQVVNNLISNAIKFTPSNGKVMVTIELKEIKDDMAKLHFSVKDSGIGIEKHKIDTIFKAFSQADNSISREFGGTGLGLAISNQYINMMGSNISVKSEINKGSEFFFDVEFEVLDIDASVKKDFDINDVNIAIINTHDGISCDMNDIVYTYLNAWNFQHKEIDNISEINEDIDILIVCAKLFDENHCKDILTKYKNLKLIYIEGFETDFVYENDRFYFIEQPMTGSSLFDALISLMDVSLYHEPQNINIDDKKTFNGNILIAEDNETNQMLISIMLEDRGISYKVVENGQEAVDEVTKNDTYDLIFMDINMPVLDGIGATKKLREKGYKKPIVSLSANVIESDTNSFKEAGVDDVLNKPIVPNELDEVLEKYLKNGEKKLSKEFDTINIKEIGSSLFIEDKEILKRLFSSLIDTFEEILDKFHNGFIDKDLIHKLKGTSGNMRLVKLYEIANDLENKIETLDDIQKQHQKDILSEHLKNAIKNIKLELSSH